MERMNCLDNYEGELDEAKFDEMAKTLNLSPLEMLATLAVFIDRKERKSKSILKPSLPTNLRSKNKKPILGDTLVPSKKKQWGSSIFSPLTNKKCSFEEGSCSYSHPKPEKLKRKKDSDEAIDNTEKPPKKKTKITYMGPQTPPDIPEEFRRKIIEMGGTDLQLVIQKPLYETDLSGSHSRLSMPVSKMRSSNFLTGEENAKLNKKGKGRKPDMEVTVLDTKLRNVEGMCLRRWNMEKDSGSSSPMYVLNKKWNDFVTGCNLKCGNIIQVWSFRVNTELHFAIVFVEEGKTVTY